MISIAIIITLIALLTGYLCYGLATQKIEPMKMDKGGSRSTGESLPDFERTDIKAFIATCHEQGISKEVANDFIISVYNNMSWQTEPMMPKLDDSRYKLWGLDDEIDEVINFIFNKYNVQPIKWSDKEVIELHTFRELLMYIDNTIKK